MVGGCLVVVTVGFVLAQEPEQPNGAGETDPPSDPKLTPGDSNPSADVSPSSVTNRVRSPKAPPPPKDAFVLRRWEMIPPAVPPKIITAQFPINTPIFSIESMAWCDNRLWMAARPRTVPQAPTTFAKLWVYNPDNNQLQAVPGLIEKNEIHGITGSGHRLWLSLEGGAGALDSQTLGVEPFAAAQGLTSEHLAGIGDAEGGVFAMAKSGAVFRLTTSGTNFVRSGGLVFPGGGGGAEPWEHGTASRQWLLATSAYEVATRHVDAPQWTLLRDELAKGSPRLERPRLQVVEGDGEGGFWIGSNAGLHWLHPEDGAIENRFSPGGVLVPGGFGVVLSPWQRPTAATHEMARQRMIEGIRDRMRLRARFARLSSEAHSTISPVTPTSRLPGGVTAILHDKNLLWIATTDGRNTNQSRILLYQPISRKWLGWFAVPYPVHCMAVNDRILFLGLEVPNLPRISALVAVEKFPLTAIPTSRWMDDTILESEMEHRVMGLPPKERNVYWFFSGQPQRLVDALAPQGEVPDDLDAESLFMLAFSHDVAGLDHADKFAEYAALLQERHPSSIFAEVARAAIGQAAAASTRPPRNGIAPKAGKPAANEPIPEPELVGETAAEVMARRDLDGDGRINPVEFKIWKGDGADFKGADSNQDGFLDLTEIEAVLKKNP